MAKRSLLLFIAIAVTGVAMFALATAVWFVVNHRQSKAASASAAQAEFARLRSGFLNQSPLVDMDRRMASDPSARPAAATPLRAFHTVVFDTRGGGRLVRISVPYWLARRYARHHGEFQWLGELTFLDDTEFDPETIRLSLAQLERRGPGLVVDYRHASGGQFISWVE